MAFDPIEIEPVNLQERAQSRILSQFRRAFVLQCILQGLVSEAQVLVEAIEGVIAGRSPLDAVGEQLDGLGRIVGQRRTIVDYSDIAWFTPDLPQNVVDLTPVWVTGAPLTESLEADDTLFRNLIEAKVFRNFAQYGSVEENQTVALLALNTAVSFKRSGMMEVDLILDFDTPSHIVSFLTSNKTDNTADNIFAMPYPQTMRISGIIYQLSPSFAPDTDGTQADIGLATVTQPIS